ncbi:MAG: hypothetical protein ACREOE_21445 [Gemmatimonadales bacterium]
MDGIERDTTKHDPRIDDAMAAETRSLTTGRPADARRRDDRLKEPTADDEATIDASTSPDPLNAGSVTGGEAEIRKELATLSSGQALVVPPLRRLALLP